MKILHVMTRFLRGGAEEKTLLELEHLRDQHSFTLATGPAVDEAALRRLEGMGIPHIEIPALQHYSPWSAPSAIRQLRRAMRAGANDLVHTHSTEAGLLAREAARREAVPRIVHTIHGLEFTRAHPFLIRRAVISFHRRLAPTTDHYFSNADVLTRAFLNEGIGRPEQYLLVRSGVDLEAVRKTPPGDLEGEPALLTAGRLERGKGMEECIEAAARLSRAWPGVRLHIAGEGPLRAELEAYAKRLGIWKHVNFLGFRPDLPALQKSAAAFVLASHREGTPRVITQAMAAACPVVATNVDGIPEQVEDGESGWLVPPRNAAMLAEALGRALGEPEEAARRARRAEERADMFGLPRMLAALTSAYKELETKPS